MCPAPFQMNRKQIADALGVSEKSVSRYVAQGRLPDRRVKGALDVLPDDVDRLRVELETPVIADAKAPELPADEPLSRALVRVPQKRRNAPESALSLESLAVAVLAIADTVNAGDKARRDTPTVAEKMLLSLDEGAALSGLSAARLRAAIRDGRLPARRIGRGFKIRADDLRAWTNSFFADEGAAPMKP